MTRYISTVKLREAGVTYNIGDELAPDACDRDRLLFLLLKDFIYPVGGYEELPEDLFLDFMEKRD